MQSSRPGLRMSLSKRIRLGVQERCTFRYMPQLNSLSTTTSCLLMAWCGILNPIKSTLLVLRRGTLHLIPVSTQSLGRIDTIPSCCLKTFCKNKVIGLVRCFWTMCTLFCLIPMVLVGLCRAHPSIPTLTALRVEHSHRRHGAPEVPAIDS